MPQESCLFCRIANKTIPADIVYEDETVMAILDIHPRAPGHVFIIPKSHYATFLNLDASLIGPVFTAVQKVGLKLKEALNNPGLSVGINQGRVSGQEIDHLHIHLIPRFEGDKGGSVQSIVNNPPSLEEQERIKKLLLA